MKDHKVLNVVLCTIVLILALASAVLSFFLFNKREAMAANSKTLSAAIHDISATLDAGSGTATAAQITAEKLSPNAEQTTVDSTLAKVKSQSQTIAKQRNDLAEAMQSIGRDASAGTGNSDDFKKVSSYKAQVAKTKSAVSRLASNYDRVKTERDRTAAALKKTRQEMGAQIQKLKSDVNSYRARYSDAVRESRQLKNQLLAEQKTNAQLKNKVSIYAKQLGISDGAEIKLWTAGSPEVLSRLAGKITKVSDEYGYVAIDLGSESGVKQTIGKRSFDINFKLNDETELTIVRNGEFIAAVKLDKVGANESIALIPVEKVGAIKVGDQVIWKASK